jgi:hypothetical protein
MRHLSDCRECGRALATEPVLWVCADCAIRMAEARGTGADLDDAAGLAPVCRPLYDVLNRVPGVDQVEPGWRLADGGWRVAFNVKANQRGWAAVQFVAWAIADEPPLPGARSAVRVEASQPPRGRPRGRESLTFCVVGQGDPTDLAAAVARRLADVFPAASAPV